MRSLLQILFLSCIAFALGTRGAESRPADPYANETAAERDARMEWWREARFGMFIHWGVYSVPAGTYNGKQIPGLGEWILHDARIPVSEYRAFARQFNPVNYKADEWVRLAKAAGMKYIVITAKHHDGFALYDTQASDWNVVDATPYGRDLLKDLADACRRHGMKLGFYYSQAQDWINGGSAARGKWDPAQERSMDDYIDRVAVPQMTEILTRYGNGIPAVLWWDTPVDMNEARATKLIELLHLRPGIIHNNRLGGGFKGDTETPEQYIPATGFKNRDWETCMTLNHTWGFKSYDHDWKSTGQLIRNLVDIASKGGNYLLNIGPTADGSIPQPSIERLQEIGRWMQVNGKAIYGTTASPFKRLAWGRCTTGPSQRMSALLPRAEAAFSQSGGTATSTALYLHVFEWPSNGKLLLPGLTNRILSARLLDGGKRLATTPGADGVTVNVPATAPDPISSTVVVEIAGTPGVIVPVLAQEANGTIALKAVEADLNGNAIQYESDKDGLGYWTDSADTASWTVDVKQPGRFSVAIETASLGESRFEIVAGNQTVSAKVSNTGDYNRFVRSELPATLEIAAPGRVTFTVKPVAQGWAPVNLRSVTLKPLSQ